MAINIDAYIVGETVSTTEWSLTTDTSGPDVDTNAGIYQAYIDVSTLAAGDVFEFKVYEKIFSTGSSARVIWKATVSGAQSEGGLVTPALILGKGWDMTAKKISGTDRLIQSRIAKVS